MQMRPLLIILCMLASHIALPSVSPASVMSIHRNSDGVTLWLNPGILKLRVFSTRTIEVIYSSGDSLLDAKILAVISPPHRKAGYNCYIYWRSGDSESQRVIAYENPSLMARLKLYSA
jgi:hypothetical protein